MGEIIRAAGRATRSSLQESIWLAASLGPVSTVEALLEIWSERFGNATEVARRAVYAAANNRNWEVAMYLASFLEDTAPPAGGHGTKGGGAAGRASLERQLLGQLDRAPSSLGEQEGFRLGEAIRPRPPPGPATTEPRPLNIKDTYCPRGEKMPRVEREIKFSHVDPQADPGEWRSAEDPSPYFSLARPEESLAILQDKDELVAPEGEIQVVFDYPFEKAHVLTLKAPTGRGFTRGELAEAIAKRYREIYREEEETSSQKPGPIGHIGPGGTGPFLLNRAQTDGKWGIWGHDLSDLDLHAVRFDPEQGTWTLGIDS